MITELQYKEMLPRYNAYKQAVTNHKELLATNGLTMSVDLATLLFEYKGNLFAKVVAVDKGLKMRYELLKTDNAIRGLVNSTIDLAGYDIVNELTNSLAKLNETLTAANHVLAGKEIEKPTVSKLLEYDLSIDAYLQKFVIVWSDPEQSKVYDLVKEYAAMLTKANNMIKGLGSNFDVKELVNMDNGNATANELKVYSMLVNVALKAKFKRNQM